MVSIKNIKGVDKVLKELKAAETKHGRRTKVSVIVGYTQNYALAVHEKIEMKWKGLPRIKPSKGFYWDPLGRAQAKFLEQPARELKKEFQRIIRESVGKGATLEQSLMMAGLRLQRESQLLVPVDTGALKNSAFTRRDV